MTREILLEDLRRKSAQRIQAIRDEAAQNITGLKRDKDREFELHRAAEERKEEEVRRTVAGPVALEAEKESLRIIDTAMAELAGRLRAMAREMLPEVRREKYDEIFSALVEELSGYQWETVTVSPTDEQLAASHFPGARILTDPDIVGGFLASADGGGSRVVNTLDMRLDKAWPFVLPILLRELEEKEGVAPPA